MKIPMKINGEEITLECNPDKNMLSILREQGCLSVKAGCEEGICGSCTVLLDNVPVPSCCLPASLARNSEIVTLEHFRKSPEYKVIANGFTKAGITLCGYCNAAKIFAAYQIISINKSLTREDIALQLQGIAPCCTDKDTLINGIIYAIRDNTVKGAD